MFDEISSMFNNVDILIIYFISKPKAGSIWYKQVKMLF